MQLTWYRASLDLRILMLSCCISFVFMSPARTFGQEAEPEVRGIPEIPGEAMWYDSHIENEVNLHVRDGVFRIPLYEFQGRGNAKFTIGLRYFTNIQNIKENLNTEFQASWVGMGWGLDVPYIWGAISAEFENNEFTDIDIKHTLVWNGVRDYFIESGDWTLTQRKYWKVTKTDDEEGYIETFTLTDLEGTKYTFEHRRETVLTLYDDEGELQEWDGLEGEHLGESGSCSNCHRTVGTDDGVKPGMPQTHHLFRHGDPFVDERHGQCPSGHHQKIRAVLRQQSRCLI